MSEPVNRYSFVTEGGEGRNITLRIDQVDGDYVAAKDYDHIASYAENLAAVLRAARCPNSPSCDGKGSISYYGAGQDLEREPCQWCHERDAALAKDPSSASTARPVEGTESPAQVQASGAGGAGTLQDGQAVNQRHEINRKAATWEPPSTARPFSLVVDDPHNCPTCGRLQFSALPKYDFDAPVAERLRIMADLYDPKHVEGGCNWCTDVGAARLMREAANWLDTRTQSGKKCETCGGKGTIGIMYADEPDYREPCPDCHQVGKERTDADYAIEFGGYLATAATRLMDAQNAVDALEELEPSAPARLRNDNYDIDVEEAHAARSEAWSGLRTAVYEFEKRRDRASRTVAGKES